MKRRSVALLSATAVVLAIACDLNPQPLPPADDTRAAPGFADASFSAHDATPAANAEGDDAGRGGAPSDAEPTEPPADAGSEDAGDAGDSSDADAT